MKHKFGWKTVEGKPNNYDENNNLILSPKNTHKLFFYNGSFNKNVTW